MTFTDLHFVIAQQQDVLLAEMLEMGKVTPQDLESRQMGMTPLMVAAGGGFAMEDRVPAVQKGEISRVRHMLQSLLAAGADIHAAGDGELAGFTAMHFCAGRYPGLVSTLIKAGADVNALNQFRQTPLIRAAGHTTAVRQLLQAGARADTLDCFSRNALFYARDVAVVPLLLAAGADPDILDTTGMSPADAAMERGYPDLAQALWTAARHVGCGE